MLKFTILFITMCLSSGQTKIKNQKQKFLPQSFKASFVQEFKSSLSGKVKKSNGKISYQYPGNIRFETLRPNHIVFVSNKKQTWYYTAPFMEGEPGELSVRPSGKTGLSKFFDVLKKGLVTNPLYKVVELKDGIELQFAKNTAQEIGLKKAKLRFKGKKKAFKEVKAIDLYYFKKKKKVTLTLASIAENQKFGKNEFLFEAPENTKISY